MTRPGFVALALALSVLLAVAAPISARRTVLMEQAANVGCG
jgi:hypothetical protein